MDLNSGKPHNQILPQPQVLQQQQSESGSQESAINPEQQSENQNQKGCNCKKSKCMKMYCECFFSGIKCTENCRCIACENVLTYDNNNNRIEGIDELQAHRKIKIQNRGCNCKKSECSKKYCQCFNAGIFCNHLCKCEQCKNVLNGQTSERALPEQIEEDGGFMQNETKEKNQQINQKLTTLLASVSEEYKASMLQFVYYLLK